MSLGLAVTIAALILVVLATAVLAVKRGRSREPRNAGDV